MSDTEIKTELHERIEHADDKQLREIYGLMLNYFNETSETVGWDMLTTYHQERITKSIEQSKAGLVTPARDILKSAREKYGLNG